MAKKGQLSINSENMLPIIKKWLYSDRDIFIREQVANASDAITKLKKLEGVGEYKPADEPDYQIRVIVDPQEKTLQFIDNGIGMTASEVEEYITQIAFSGASDFLKQYEGKTDGDQIIGHFGLGFYSAFMVADEVHIDSLSYRPDAKAVHWESDGEAEYSIEDGTRAEVGTTITLFLNDDCLEFCNAFRVREVLGKYCSFMPIPIFLEEAGKEETKEAVAEDAGEDAASEEESAKEAPTPINDTNPLWTRLASEVTAEEYKDFYRKVFNDYKEPLFQIHLNTEYPFHLRGILYFPQINTEYDAIEAQIKLYNNQVFIADNIKEVIPEFLMTLKGVIDCPDLPLNVSRSALQNDGTVAKISEYISKKVADKLAGMCKTEREDYEKNWDAISPFIKYGCIRDEKFADKMMDYMLFKNLDGKYLTLAEYEEKAGIPKEAPANDASDNADTAAQDETTADGNAEENAPADTRATIFYVTDEVQQAPYIAMFQKGGKDAVILKHNIDTPFITQLEARNSHIRFARIDAELADELKSEEAVDEKEAEDLQAIFRKHLAKENLKVRAEKMTDADVAAVITFSEESRRMQDMMRAYGGGADLFAGEETLVINVNHPLVRYLAEHRRAQAVPVICKQLYDLAMLAHKPLQQEEMAAFVKRSNEIMMLLTK